MSEEPAGYQTGPVFNIFAYFQWNLSSWT
jgi:hypothetical protein